MTLIDPSVMVIAIGCLFAVVLAAHHRFVDVAIESALVDLRVLRWAIARDVDAGRVPADSEFQRHVDSVAETLGRAPAWAIPGPVATIVAMRLNPPAPNPALAESIRNAPGLVPHANEYLRIVVTIMLYRSPTLWLLARAIVVVALTLDAYDRLMRWATPAADQIATRLAQAPGLAQA